MKRFIRYSLVVTLSVLLATCAEMKRAGKVSDDVPVWMELPSTSQADYECHTHWFRLGGQNHRNYTFAWSQKDLVSLWVAYPLCSMHTEKKVSRTEAWSYDPVLGEICSPAPFKGYAGSYARGHQLPSADRMCCREANEQTFYGSNIMPQLDEHNEGIWNKLESYVRKIAEKADTVYVVTGCIVKNSEELTTDTDGKTITVPVAFYKALLRYEEGASWSGAAFYTEHKNYGKKANDLKAVSMSIDQLEQKTGIDFFVNLPAKIGEKEAAAVEARDPASLPIWKLNH